MKDVINTTTFSCRVVAAVSLALCSSSERTLRVSALLRLSGGVGASLQTGVVKLRPVRQVALTIWHATFPSMYVVTEADAAAIREAYETGGELSAAVELRRRFPGIIENATAREQARRIAAWDAAPDRPLPHQRSRKRKDIL